MTEVQTDGERVALIAQLRDDSARHADSDRRICNKAADMLDADAQQFEQTCNCRFDGDVNTQQCTLHNAWAETLNEQAGFRRERDALRAQQESAPAYVPLSEDEIDKCWEGRSRYDISRAIEQAVRQKGKRNA